MPSTSKSQQRLMGVAYAVKNGDMQLSDVDAAYREEVKNLVDNMTLKQLKDFASTKHDGLPERVKEAVDLSRVKSNMQSISQKEWDKTNKDYKTVINGQKYKMVYDDGRDATILVPVVIEEDLATITPNMLGGMGDVVLPNAGALGSGDAPAGISDPDGKKKKKAKLIMSMEEFMNEQHKQIEPFMPEQPKDEETGGGEYSKGTVPLPDKEFIARQNMQRKAKSVVGGNYE